MKSILSFPIEENETQKSEVSYPRQKSFSVFQEETTPYTTLTTLNYFSLHIPLGRKWTDGTMKSQLTGSSWVTLLRPRCCSGAEASNLLCSTHCSFTGHSTLQGQHRDPNHGDSQGRKRGKGRGRCHPQKGMVIGMWEIRFT